MAAKRKHRLNKIYFVIKHKFKNKKQSAKVCLAAEIFSNKSEQMLNEFQIQTDENGNNFSISN